MNEPAGPAALAAVLHWIDTAATDAVAQLDEVIEARERQLAFLRTLRANLAAPTPDAPAKPAKRRHPPMPKPQNGTAVLPNPICRTATNGDAGSDPQPMEIDLVIVERLARLIHQHGPLAAPKLAALAHVGQSTVYEATLHPWFDTGPGGYHLSQRCLVELLQKEDEAI